MDCVCAHTYIGRSLCRLHYVLTHPKARCVNRTRICFKKRNRLGTVVNLESQLVELEEHLKWDFKTSLSHDETVKKKRGGEGIQRSYFHLTSSSVFLKTSEKFYRHPHSLQSVFIGREYFRLL